MDSKKKKLSKTSVPSPGTSNSIGCENLACWIDFGNTLL